MKNKVTKVRQLVKARPNILRKQSGEIDPDLATVPRITNETVAEHREEVLKGARKYIYPLQHSKHRIIMITTGILIATVLGFLGYCIVGLYKLKQENAFLYRVTQVIPFPVAKAGGRFVAYENYLFEMRHYIHYYETQQQQSFNSEDDKKQLEDFRKTVLKQIVDNAYVKQLAEQNGVSVSDKEVSDRIELVKAQNRLGNNNRVFEDVLKEYRRRTLRDFERSLRTEILNEKVIAKLDTETTGRANAALVKIKAGTSFTDVAKEMSDDPAAKTTGGDYGIKIDQSTRDIPPQVVDALFKMQKAQVSEVINTGRTLEIVQLTASEGGKVTAAHITFNLKDISEFINPLKDKQKARLYIKL